MPTATIWMLCAGAAVWSLWALGARALLRNPRGDVFTGLVYHAFRAYARMMHGLRASGQERLRGTRNPGPLIVVANHTAGVDPVLIQASCAFEIRWLMAADMRAPWLDEFWEWAGVIFVDRGGGPGRGSGQPERRAKEERDEADGDGGDTGGRRGGGTAGAMREALRHLRRGGVIGIFPEGRIHREAGTVGEFRPGLDLLLARSGAMVLPVVVRGTPRAKSAWGSLWKRSRSGLEFLEPIPAELAKANPELVRTRMTEALQGGREIAPE